MNQFPRSFTQSPQILSMTCNALLASKTALRPPRYLASNSCFTIKPRSCIKIKPLNGAGRSLQVCPTGVGLALGLLGRAES